MAEHKTQSRRPTKAQVKELAKTQATGLVTVGGHQVKGFIDFIRTQGVIGLAVGLVLGTAVGTVVKSLVDNVVMPPIGLLLGSGDGLRGLTWTIGEANGDPAVIAYGIFLNDFINFLVIALVIYFIFDALGLTKLDKKKA